MGVRRPAMTGLCHFCRNLHDSAQQDNPTCNAFPKGIPDMIYGEAFYDDFYGTTIIWRYDHRQPIGLDEGIQFEKATYSELRNRQEFADIVSLDERAFHVAIDLKLQKIEEFLSLGRIQGLVMPHNRIEGLIRYRWEPKMRKVE